MVFKGVHKALLGLHMLSFGVVHVTLFLVVCLVVLNLLCFGVALLFVL